MNRPIVYYQSYVTTQMFWSSNCVTNHIQQTQSSTQIEYDGAVKYRSQQDISGFQMKLRYSFQTILSLLFASWKIGFDDREILDLKSVRPVRWSVLNMYLKMLPSIEWQWKRRVLQKRITACLSIRAHCAWMKVVGDPNARSHTWFTFCMIDLFSLMARTNPLSYEFLVPVGAIPAPWLVIVTMWWSIFKLLTASNTGFCSHNTTQFVSRILAYL